MRASSFFLLFVLCAFVFTGCTTEEPKVESPAPTQVAGIPEGKMPDDDVHRGLQAHSASEPSAKLATLKTAQGQAKATFQKNPKDAKAKTAYIDATVKLGTATMNAAELPPREKY